MYILTIKDAKDHAYSATTNNGERTLQIFVDEDDAIRYAGLLEADDHPELDITEVDEESIVKACEFMGYKYSIITPDEFVIPKN